MELMEDFKPYQSKDLLNYYYGMAQMSQPKIAEIYQVHAHTIYYWMKKLGIESRSLSEANHLARGNHVSFSQKVLEWIDGELLGDGNLMGNNFSAYYQHTSKYFKYIDFISKSLLSFGINRNRTGIREQYYPKMDCYSFHYRSLSYTELLPIYKHWYPKGKKSVPRDLKLTPLICRQWHIGDGCLIHPKDSRPSINLATCGFSIPDVEWLVIQLNTLGFLTTRTSSNNTIHISVHSTKDFLNYIDPCPEEIKSIYGYKWDYCNQT